MVRRHFQHAVSTRNETPYRQRGARPSPPAPDGRPGADGALPTAHPRVDETKLGATGVSLGGWLSMQTAVLSDRIAAVADFGRKTVAIPPGMTAKQFRGMTDLCHIIPGMAAICDRNLLSLAYCPRPLLAGHGRKDAGSHRQGPVHFKSVFAGQYRKLGKGSRFQYHVHDGADTMPEKIVVEYFREVFGLKKASRNRD